MPSVDMRLARKDYAELYGEDLKIRKCDCILTAAGSVGKFGVFSDAYFRTWGEDQWVSANLMGDMAGLLVPPDHEKQLAWLGVRPADIDSVAKQAAKRGKPGVILACACGDKNLAKVIFECCVSLKRRQTA